MDWNACKGLVFDGFVDPHISWMPDNNLKKKNKYKSERRECAMMVV